MRSLASGTPFCTNARIDLDTHPSADLPRSVGSRRIVHTRIDPTPTAPPSSCVGIAALQKKDLPTATAEFLGWHLRFERRGFLVRGDHQARVSPFRDLPVLQSDWKAGREGAPPCRRWELPCGYPILRRTLSDLAPHLVGTLMVPDTARAEPAEVGDCRIPSEQRENSVRCHASEPDKTQVFRWTCSSREGVT